MQQLKSFLSGKAHVIWDWNGTLLDDTALAVKAMSRILRARGLPPLEVESYREVFGFPIKDYYERIGLRASGSELNWLADEFHKNYDEEFHICGLHLGAKEILSQVREEGLLQSVLSAAQQTWLLRQLEFFGIRDFFSEVYGLTDFLAAGKLERGQELIAKSGFAKSATIMIGDTDHDVEVARALGIEVVILAGGHQAAARFSGMNVPVLARSESLNVVVI